MDGISCRSIDEFLSIEARQVDFLVGSDDDTVAVGDFFGSLKNTDFVMNNSFWVGVYPGMTDEMVDYMAKTILEAIRA